MLKMYLVRSVNGRHHFCVALFQVRAAVRLVEHTHFAPNPAQLVGPPAVRPQSLSAQQIHRSVRKVRSTRIAVVRTSSLKLSILAFVIKLSKYCYHMSPG